MNSLLQSLFLTNSFRKVSLSVLSCCAGFDRRARLYTKFLPRTTSPTPFPSHYNESSTISKPPINPLEPPSSRNHSGGGDSIRSCSTMCRSSTGCCVINSRRR